jgi:glycosyltransferase involved in cell wall biosynthesis
MAKLTQHNPKYTIIIPTKNSVEYLKDCVNSVVSQDFTNYELIISDNCSHDNTYNYVESLKHPRIRLVKPSTLLELADHWEYALGFASGEWVTILGSDDGLMPYSFKLLEYLTETANLKKINVINAVRAYFFWDGVQDIYGDTAISYSARSACFIKSSQWGILEATVGNKSYINLPQMYTTSIIRKTVIEKAKAKNGGSFYSTTPPDANGAAIICLLEDKYIESLIPIGWVGSSPRSGPIRWFKKQNKKEYFLEEKQMVTLSKFPEQMGVSLDKDDNLHIVHNHKLYLWASLLQTKYLQPFWMRILFNSKIFKILLFTRLYIDIKDPSSEQINYLRELCAVNKIDYTTVSAIPKFFLYKKACRIFSIIEKFKNKFHVNNSRAMALKKSYPLKTVPRLMDAYYLIDKMDMENNFIGNFMAITPPPPPVDY